MPKSRHNRHDCHATSVPHGFGCSVGWFRDGKIVGVEECADFGEAMKLAERVRLAIRG